MISWDFSWLVLRLGTSMAVGTLLVFVVGVLAPFLVEDLRLSTTEVGALPSGFFLAAAVTSPVAGSITDRIGPRESLVLLNILVAVALVLLAVAPGIEIAVLAVVTGGVAAAISNPATNRVVADRIADGRRGVLMGLKQAGVPAGSVLAGALLPTMAEHWGWRRAALAGVCLPAIGAVLATGTMPSVPPTAPTAAREPASRPQTDQALQTARMFALLMGGASGLINSFLVLYLFADLGFTARSAGTVAAAMGAVAVVFRVALSHAGEHHVSPRVILMAVGAAGTVASLLTLASAAWGAWAVWGGALLAGASIIAFQGVLNLLILQLRPVEDVGRSSGFVLRGFFVGLLITPVVFGAVVDATADYRWLWLGQVALCVLATWLVAAWKVPGHDGGAVA